MGFISICITNHTEMKKLNRTLWILVFLACYTSITAQVAITPDGSAPHASAMLDVKSTEKGILVPRMSSTQRSAVVSPAQGLLVYDLNTESFWFYSGTAWEELISGYTSILRDADNDTKVQVEESPDDDIIRFDAAGAERMTILNTGNIGIGTTAPANKLSILGSSTSSATVLKSETSFSGNQHVHAIEGTALPAVGYGKGGYFTGGARGVQAYGEGGASASMIIGVEGTATGTAGIRVGLFGRAQGGAANWAGYFDDGNVYIKGRSGVGTLLPEARIHTLENSTPSFPHLRLTETSANDYARIKLETQSDPGIFWDIAGRSDTSASESRLNFYYSNPGFIGDKMTITGEGNVGIGTSSPVNRLRVHGSSTSTQHVLTVGTNYSGNVHIRAIEGISTPGIGYGLGGYFVGGQKGIEAIGSGGASAGEIFGVIGGATGTAGTHIGLYGWATGGSINWAGRFAQGDVWIENNLRTDANVMIGTSSTSNKLRVHGSNDTSTPVINVTTAYTSSADVIGIQTNCIPAIGYGIGGSFTGGRRGINSIANSSSSAAGCTAVDAQATGTAGTKIGIRGNASGAGINWAGYFAQGNVYVDNEIRVGSGAINGATGYKMAVDGKIIAEEVRVQMSGAWPDYVFESGYELMQLDTLKSYILENKHLPGIPPAEQMDMHGLALGEMQIKQMQKVEELTLYIIALQEQLNKMEAKLTACINTANPK